MRLFFALPFTHDTRSAIIETLEPLKGSFGGLRWLPASSMHITLHFLGERGREETEALRKRFRDDFPLALGTEGMSAFTLSWEKIGSFPKGGKPRVMHLPVEKGADKVLLLRDLLCSVLNLPGEEKRRRFKPHITLARYRQGKNVPPEWAEKRDALIVRGKALAERVVLYRSHLERGGARYEVLESVELPR